MKRLLLACALALSPAAVSAADLSGAWKISGDFLDGKIVYSLVCTLSQDGDKLSGPCLDDHGASLQVSGAMQGDDIDLAYDTTFQGSPVHLAYKGAVQADGSLKGSVDAGMAQGVFVAVKQ